MKLHARKSIILILVRNRHIGFGHEFIEAAECSDCGHFERDKKLKRVQ
jgi:hypothetical protein